MLLRIQIHQNSVDKIMERADLKLPPIGVQASWKSFAWCCSTKPHSTRGRPVQQAAISRQDGETERWVWDIGYLTGARRLSGQGHCRCLATVRASSYGTPHWSILQLWMRSGWGNALTSVVGNFSSGVFSSYSVLMRRFHDLLRSSSLLNGTGSW